MSSLEKKNIIVDSLESPRGALCTDWFVNEGYLELGFSLIKAEAAA